MKAQSLQNENEAEKTNEIEVIRLNLSHVTAENGGLYLDKGETGWVQNDENEENGVVYEKKSRKRKRDESSWKKKKAAIARERGEEYISYKEKMVPAKQVEVGLLCPEKCRLKCSDKFDVNSRREIHSRFYKLDINAKNALLFKSIQLCTVQRQRTNAHLHKTASYKFKIQCNTNTYQVCKTAFCSLYGVGRKKVDLLQNQIKMGNSAPSPDSRGKHTSRPHKIEEEVVNFVKAHIRSFPAEESHYSRHKNPNKLFLSPILSISKMYNLYLEKCEEEKKSRMYKVKKHSYSNIFSTYFNYSFGVPRSDTCSTCDSGKGNIEHKENYEAAFQLQRRDRKYAAKNCEALYITVDLQQTMPLPRLITSKAFYLRQMWFYNLGIHAISTNGERGYFFTWTEDVAGRGSREVTSALCTFLEFNKECIKDKKHLIVWSDSCAGQNKNFQTICLYQYLVLKGVFSIIDHKFPEIGHSYLDSDRDFGRIEKVLRKQETIYVPDQYRDLIRGASKNNHVTDMTNHFRDIDNLQTQLKVVQKKKNLLNEKIAFRDGIKWLRVEEFGSYLYKENYDSYTPFKKVSILQNEKRKPDSGSVQFRRVNEKVGKLSEKKLANLRDQLPYVKEEYRWFYEQILGQELTDITNRRKTN